MVIILFLFDKHRTVYIHWIPEGKTVNQYYYAEVLNALCERVMRQRPDFVKNQVLDASLMRQSTTPYL